MIKVKRLNGKEFVVNCDLILYFEETPDTIITLTTGQKIVTSNTVDEIIDKVIEHKSKIIDFSNKSYRKEV